MREYGTSRGEERKDVRKKNLKTSWDSEALEL